MNKSHLLLGFLLLFSMGSWAQGIRGKILDSNRKPIPYANIFVPELNKGTTSNAEGNYELKLPTGNWDVMFRYMGYETQKQRIQINQDFSQVNINLRAQTMQLPEVTILASGEDPAYYIMRQAIAMSPYFRKQVGEYSCRVYLKGSGHMYKIPLFFRKKMKNEGIELNRTYSSESVSQIHFEQPDKITQKVEAVRTSVLDESFNNITMPLVNLSLYENWEMKVEDYRVSIVSPLDKHAFSTYRFKLVGSFSDQGQWVNKIEVTPKVKGKNKFEGSICIVDGSWCLHSTDLKFSVPFAQIEMKQIYSLIDNKVWMPTSQIYNIDGGLMGFAGKANYVASASNYRVKLNAQLRHQLLEQQNNATSNSIPGNKTKTSENTVESNREMRQAHRKLDREVHRQAAPKSLEIKDPYVLVEAKANNDSAFWNELRPVPLTSTEQESFNTRDKAAENYKPRLRSDNTNAIPSHFHTIPLLLNFNTIDGYKPGLKFNYSKRDSTGSRVSATLVTEYGISSKQFYGTLHSKYIWNGKKRQGVTASLGRKTSDFKGENAYRSELNSLYMLVFENNSQKLYDQHFAELSFFSDLIDGLNLHVSSRYSNRQAVENHNTWSLIDWHNRELTANTLNLPEGTAEQFTHNRNWQFRIKLDYTPLQYYRIYKGYKYNEPSTYPTFWLDYRQAIPMGKSSDSSYAFMQLGARQRLKLSPNSTLNYNLIAGAFHGQNQATPDFYYTKSNAEYIDFGSSWQQFNTAPYYLLFSKRNFVALHSQLQCSKLLLKRLPLLNSTLWQESVQLHYFSSESTHHYLEFGYGIGNAIFNLSVNYGLENWETAHWNLHLCVQL
ncbi:MAG: DUF5686 and carboxypeptidase regulatory-like domain-containing protein [Mangrovibacterium sp.]